MVALPQMVMLDPTLEAADAALVELSKREPRRRYLGMSAIGDDCSRKLWYNFNLDKKEEFTAQTLKRFDDGHRSEDLIALRLRMVRGITLLTLDPDTGRQYEVSDHGGRFAGHLDGKILGLLQSPKTWHVFEAKSVNEKSFAQFKSLKFKLGEKNTLAEWNPVYHAQCQAYLGYTGLTRHYLVVSTPSVRDWDSVRTEFDPDAFAAIKDKARRILDAKVPLARVSNKPDFWQCGWCHHKAECHNLEEPTS